MTVLNANRRMDGEFRYPSGHDNTGLKDHIAAERNAKQGSRALLQAMEKCIFRFGFKYAIGTEDARHLLLNTGVRLPRKPFLLSQAA